jgi:nitrogen fixation/metabolism regulation signal transduction histidine kinase
VGKSALLTQEEILHLTSLRELFGAFAHEISQPLNAIMIAAQVLQLRIQRSSLTDEEKTFLVNRLGVVLSQVQRASGIVDDVRSLSRQTGPECAKPDISVLVDKVHGLIGQQFMGRGIELTKGSAVMHATVAFDPRTVECTLVQCLAFARDSVEAIGEWHDREGIAFNRAVAVNCVAAPSASMIRVEWNIGQLGEDQVRSLTEPSRHAGLNAASSVMISLGGNLEWTPTSLLLTIR